MSASSLSSLLSSSSTFAGQPPDPPPPPHILQIRSSFKPSRRRPNRLRPKLPAPPSPTPPPAPPITLPSNYDEVTPADVASHSIFFDSLVRSDPAPVITHTRWFPGPVLDLCFKFAALLVVQTLAAVWFLGGTNIEAGTDGEESVIVKEGEKNAEVAEFDEKVLEIRAMAREARVMELKERDEERGVKGEVDQRLDRIRERHALVNLGKMDYSSSSSKKKNGDENNSSNSKTSNGSKRKRRAGVVSAAAKALDAPRGFSGSKNSDGEGGLQRIAIRDVGEETENQHGSRELASPDFYTNEKFVDRNSALVSSAKESLHTQGGVSKGALNLEDIHLQSDGKQLQNSIMERHSAPKLSSSSKSKSKSSKCFEQVDSATNKKVVKQLGDPKKTWLKLPYVLAIYLRRGVNLNGPGGLYTLKVGSSSNGRSFASYTVVFQDQGDATNFCYLLESFFRELGDVSADIVPLTIQELGEAVTSGEEVIFVKKGQLRLYAGQPLAEAEAALLSLLN